MSMIPGGFGFGFPGGRGSGSIFDDLIPFPFPFPPSPFFGDGSSDVSAFAGARMDWRETADAHVFKADLPGVRKDEVKVEVEDGRVLQISGERRREAEERTDTWHRVERSSGRFLRRFRLPENAKVDEVRAAMEDGVLTVTVPKEGVKKPEVKSVQISG